MFEYHMFYVLYPFVTYLLTVPLKYGDNFKEFFEVISRTIFVAYQVPMSFAFP
jgi:hypothetical protein